MAYEEVGIAWTGGGLLAPVVEPAATDAHGRFRFDGLPAGPYRVEWRRKDSPHSMPTAVRSVELEETEGKELLLDADTGRLRILGPRYSDFEIKKDGAHFGYANGLGMEFGSMEIVLEVGHYELVEHYLRADSFPFEIVRGRVTEVTLPVEQD